MDFREHETWGARVGLAHALQRGCFWPKADLPFLAWVARPKSCVPAELARTLAMANFLSSDCTDKVRVIEVVAIHQWQIDQNRPVM